MRGSQIYGITGRKNHGKDTFARLVWERNPNFTILHFADDLKQMCAAVFGLSEKQMHDSVLKEELLGTPVKMDAMLHDMRLVTGLDIQKQHKIAYTPREIMQYFGSEYVRSVQDGYWIQKVLTKIGKIKAKVLVADTRFPNEATALQGVGGRIIKVVRPDYVNTEVGAQHQSETQIDEIKEDVCFHFKTGGLVFARRLAVLIARNRYHQAEWYHQPIIDRMLHDYEAGATMLEVGKHLGKNLTSPYNKVKRILKYYGVPVRHGRPAGHG